MIFTGACGICLATTTTMSWHSFAATGFEVSEAQYKGWAGTEEEDRFIMMTDRELAIFLNGIIIQRREPQEGPLPPVPEEEMSNNTILRKLKIAFNMRSEDMLEIFALVDRKLSPHELSAFFRKPSHKSYRYVKGQYLRNFLMGLQLKYKSSLSHPK